MKAFKIGDHVGFLCDGESVTGIVQSVDGDGDATVCIDNPGPRTGWSFGDGTGRRGWYVQPPLATLLDAPAPDPLPVFMRNDSESRKLMPVSSGVFAYFPDALLCIAWLSRVANAKHCPGEPLRWAKEKSADEADAGARHALDELRGAPVDPELADLGDVAHLTQKAWRANAELQRKCDEIRARLKARK